MSNLLLNAKQELAANLVSSDFLTYAKIALVIGISRRTLQYWKTGDEFRKQVKKIIAVHRRICRREFLREIDPEFDTPDPHLE